VPRRVCESTADSSDCPSRIGPGYESAAKTRRHDDFAPPPCTHLLYVPARSVDLVDGARLAKELSGRHSVASPSHRGEPKARRERKLLPIAVASALSATMTGCEQW